MTNFIRVKVPERERERDVASRLRCAHDRECRTEESEWSGEGLYDYVQRVFFNATQQGRAGKLSWLRIPRAMEHQCWRYIRNYIYWNENPNDHGGNRRCFVSVWPHQVLLRHACGGCNHLVTEVAA